MAGEVHKRPVWSQWLCERYAVTRPNGGAFIGADAYIFVASWGLRFPGVVFVCTLLDLGLGSVFVCPWLDLALGLVFVCPLLDYDGRGCLRVSILRSRCLRVYTARRWRFYVGQPGAAGIDVMGKTGSLYTSLVTWVRHYTSSNGVRGSPRRPAGGAQGRSRRLD